MAASAYFPPARPFFGHFMAILCGAAPTHGRNRLFFPRSTVFRPRFRVAAPTHGLIRSFFGHFTAVFAWQHRRMAASDYFSTAQPYFGLFYVAAPTRGSIRSFFPAFRPFFGHFTWQRQRKAPTRGTDGAMYTHGHVHEGAPFLKILSP
jgi:hypothetical protein